MIGARRRRRIGGYGRDVGGPTRIVRGAEWPAVEVPNRLLRKRFPDTIKLHMDVPPDVGYRPPRARRAAGAATTAAPAAARWTVPDTRGPPLAVTRASTVGRAPHNHLYANATWRHNTTAINITRRDGRRPFRERDDRCQRALPAEAPAEEDSQEADQAILAVALVRGEREARRGNLS